jgi:hypothetical protein
MKLPMPKNDRIMYELNRGSISASIAKASLVNPRCYVMTWFNGSVSDESLKFTKAEFNAHPNCTNLHRAKFNEHARKGDQFLVSDYVGTVSQLVISYHNSNVALPLQFPATMIEKPYFDPTLFAERGLGAGARL